MIHLLRLAAVTGVCLGLMGGAALAQAPSPREACMDSARALCPSEVATFDRKAVKACLLKNLDKAAPACRAAIQAAQAAAAKP